MIEEAIQTNETVYKKIKLMKQKMEELKDLFQEESLERLETLQFKLSDIKRSKRKSNKKVIKPSTDAKEAITEPLKEEIDSTSEVTIINASDIEKLEEGWT